MAILAFGANHPDFQAKVLNEREARAGAGILLFFEPIQRVAPGQLAALAAVVVTVGLAIGHEEQWKLHNGCN
jgi:hypothetical protein